jgi:hypothetical protein
MTYLIEYEPWEQAVQLWIAAAIVGPILIFKVLYWCGFFNRKSGGTK